MKTFSIACGRYQVHTEDTLRANPGGASVGSVGGAPPDINAVEAQRVAIDQAILNPPVEGEGAEPAEAGAEVHPFHIEPGDVLDFGVDGEDYSTCVLTAWHADGSKDFVKLHRNSFVLSSGWEGPPEPAAASSPDVVTPGEEPAPDAAAPGGNEYSDDDYYGSSGKRAKKGKSSY